jgi:hypothetical protein
MTPLAHLAYPEKCRLGGVRWRALWAVWCISLYPIACVLAGTAGVCRCALGALASIGV